MATGTLLPSPWLYALDDSGVTLPGAKAYFFAAGTSTPIDTFSNVTLTTPNANPVVADAAGRIGPIYIEPGLSYKLTLNTSADVLVRTLDNIGAVPTIASAPPVVNSVCDARLSLTTAVPVTTADVTAATLVYVEPYAGNRVALYDGSTWNSRSLSAFSFAVPATTDTNYDVFLYDNNGTVAAETLVWTNATTRATGLVVQDGVLSRSALVTRRYLGSFRTTGVSGQCEDSAAKRYLFNYYHRVRKPLRVVEATNSWPYSTAVWRQANANAANQLDILCGWAEVPIEVTVLAVGNNSTAGVNFYAGIGEDSTSALATGVVNNIGPAISGGNTLNHPATAQLRKFPAVGRHIYVWLEYSDATITTTWLGDNGALLGQSGIFGNWEC